MFSMTYHVIERTLFLPVSTTTLKGLLGDKDHREFKTELRTRYLRWLLDDLMMYCMGRAMLKTPDR
jgi:hypothetical protein